MTCGAISDNGTLTIPSGTTVTANGYVYFTRPFDSSTTISDAGTIDFYQSTNTVHAIYTLSLHDALPISTTIGTNNITNVGNLLVSGGTLTLNNSAAPTIGNITAQGG